ncbi:DUF192 domain-containing protein [Candidatus Nitrosocosmicus franklandus]|uniref:DUF192 domain-containing protein n=1 Tax=Candidatus Nitrosocosmicus franklandianus TaxID=1798806 RepID=A0A484I8I6_9ARCH|nr:DUF192 domain-containing protein [Candidatus Nitrosocosmicus franklandus]VFJ14020.1 conserved protein of unknown function [Candidatus Nitrosocosmicus franklandus]
MVKKITLLIPVIISAFIIGILGILFIPSDIVNKDFDFSKGTIKIDDELLTVEIADTDFDRKRWLTFRDEKLSPDSGLLLIYDKPDLYAMWLLNIRFPIDLMWFDQEGDLVYLKKNAQPCETILDSSECTFKNTNPAKFILAGASGFIQYHNISEHSKLEIISA